MYIEKSQFGTTADGTIADLFTLSNDSGFTASITNFGGILTSVKMPDKNGDLDEITLGFNSLTGYLEGHPYFGAIVGRYANRIAGGKFTLYGKKYTLYCNDGNNHLHGGKIGYDKVLWSGTSFDDENEIGVKLTYRSKNREEGYPGNVDIEVTYTLTQENDLIISYEAAPDKTTPINMTNHAYWNLSGEKTPTVLHQELTLFADSYLLVNDELIPTGELADVATTPFDFTKKKKIGKEIEQVEGGYDHCFVIRSSESALAPAADLYDPTSGRKMTISTTKPGIQLYTGNFLEGEKSREGRICEKHAALCLETQYYPDAVNQPGFPSAIVRGGKRYSHTTKHSFSIV